MLQCVYKNISWLHISLAILALMFCVIVAFFVKISFDTEQKLHHIKLKYCCAICATCIFEFFFTHLHEI